MGSHTQLHLTTLTEAKVLSTTPLQVLRAIKGHSGICSLHWCRRHGMSMCRAKRWTGQVHKRAGAACNLRGTCEARGSLQSYGMCPAPASFHGAVLAACPSFIKHHMQYRTGTVLSDTHTNHATLLVVTTNLCHITGCDYEHT